MRIAIQPYGSHHIDAFGGGELRWALNWAHYLRSLGHTVKFVPPGQDSGFHLYIDAPTDGCEKIKSPIHIHNQFSGGNYPEWSKHFSCFESDKCYISHPYRAGYENSKIICEDLGGYTPIFLPTAYPDSLKPAYQGDPFERKEIVWATKDPFHKNFVPESSGNHYIVQCGIWLLKALARLQQRSDFQIHFIMSQCLKEAPKSYGVDEILSSMNSVQLHEKLPWSRVLAHMSRAKLNVPVNGLEGSRMESVFCEGLPLTPCNHVAFGGPLDTLLLPNARGMSEELYYSALETFWFDEQAYTKAWEHHQDIFIEHRDDSLANKWQKCLEIVGVS